MSEKLRPVPCLRGFGNCPPSCPAYEDALAKMLAGEVQENGKHGDVSERATTNDNEVTPACAKEDKIV